MGLSDRFKKTQPEVAEIIEKSGYEFVPVDMEKTVSIPYLDLDIKDTLPVAAATNVKAEMPASEQVDLTAQTVMQPAKEVSEYAGDDLTQYINDTAVSKIVVLGKTAKIYRDGKLSECINLLAPLSSYTKPVFRYVENNLIISGVRPPVSATECLTIEKIPHYSPAELIAKNLYTKEQLAFIQKALPAKKNIVVVNDENAALLNTIARHILGGQTMAVLQDLPLVSAPNITDFITAELDSSDFSTLLKPVLSLETDYLLANLEESKVAEFLSATAELSGKIVALSAPNAQAAMLKLINMIMTYEHCNEKIAKSKLLHSFNYIVDKTGIYVITPAKTAVITLKEVPV